MSQINYRPLEKTDVEAVQHVAMQAWLFTYKDIFDTQFIEQFVGQNYALERLSQLANCGQSFFHLALDNNLIIGFINIGRRRELMEIFRIYLLPSYIGKGVGYRLLQLGEGYIRSKNESKYFCFVHKKNRFGKEFYVRQNFTHIPEKDLEDEWYMEKQLSKNCEAK